MRCRYNVVAFLQNTHNRHHTDHLSGWEMRVFCNFTDTPHCAITPSDCSIIPLLKNWELYNFAEIFQRISWLNRLKNLSFYWNMPNTSSTNHYPMKVWSILWCHIMVTMLWYKIQYIDNKGMAVLTYLQTVLISEKLNVIRSIGE